MEILKELVGIEFVYSFRFLLRINKLYFINLYIFFI